ncbi:MAG: hypothetical protein QNJ91_05995 [Gammaproteobacteria bacterium]|nr:hypothetical protein [Gammaproteobacteria bacterium]
MKPDSGQAMRTPAVTERPRISMICPDVPGGVLDYALAVSARLGAGTGDVVRLTADGVPAWPLPADADVVVHWSGYGYSRRGTPLWLLRRLAAQRPRIRRLAVVFHELYASGPPWTSAFWLSPLQRRLTRRLAELADFRVASRRASADWLAANAPGAVDAVLPVPSNVGELADADPPRQPAVVVFGGAPLRAATYRSVGSDLFAWLSRHGLTLHDIGPPIDDPRLQRDLEQSGARRHGYIDADAVQAVLREARYGLLAYPVAYLAKSGVFAAYAANAVAPVVLGAPGTNRDGLRAGEHFLAGLPRDDDDSACACAGVAGAAWDWYQPHRVGVHAATLARLFAPVTADRG